MGIVLGGVQPATESAKIKIEKTSKLTCCIWLNHTTGQRRLCMPLGQVPIVNVSHLFQHNC